MKRFFFIAVFLLLTCLATKANAAIVNIQNSSSSALFKSGSFGSATSTFLNNTTAGDMVIVFEQYGGTSASVPTGCSDDASPSDTFNQIFSVWNSNGDQSMAMYYALNIKGGKKNIITCTFTTSTQQGFISTAIHEYSGVATSNALDTTSTFDDNTGASFGTLQTGTTTPTTNGDLIFGGMVEGLNEVGDTCAALGSFTARINQCNAAGLIDEDYIQPTAAAISATASLSPTTTEFVGGIASFKAAPPASTGYLYYRSITVTSTASVASGTQTNFPMLVSSTVSSWETVGNGGKVQNLCTTANGVSEPCDLIFATSSANCNATPLNFETESYTSSTGALVDWVNVPSLSAGTVIYACYDAAAVTTDQSHPSSTWNSNYAGVYHMSDNAANTNVKDSTFNGNTGTATANTNTLSTPAMIGNGLNYPAFGSQIPVTNTTASLNIGGQIALEAWYKSNGFSSLSAGNAMQIVANNCGGSTCDYYLEYNAPNTGGTYIEVGQSANFPSVYRAQYPFPSSPDGTFHFVVGTYDGTNWNLYYDGVFATSSAAVGQGAVTSTSASVTLGGSLTKGVLNEVRISNVGLSSSWILTEYNNQSSPNTFYSLGGETSLNTNTSGYAWGNKLGWVNFGTSFGNLQVLTTTVIGYAWSQNFGWINMAPASSGVINDGYGNLSGYAWGQNAGWINFMGVTIDSSGTFHGVASGTVAGSLVFDSSTGCVYCNVVTTWTPPPPVFPASVSAVSINGNNPSTITLTPNTITNVNVEATITDSSCSKITGGTTTILLYRSGVTSSSCLTNSGLASTNLNCYLATVFTASSTCSGGSQNTTTTFNVQYYAQATDASSSFPSQNWMATVIFNDSSSTTSTADSSSASTTNDIATMVALNLPTSAMNYGNAAPSSTTGNVNQLVNAENAGNASTTIQVSGTALVLGGNIIATSSQHYATSTFTFGGGEQALSNTATTITGINIAPVSRFPISGAGWAGVQSLPYKDNFHTSVAYNGYLYNLGGVGNGATTSTVLYAPINATGSIGAWSMTQSLPYKDYYHTSVAYNGYLYNLGGVGNGADTSTVLYAPINATGSIGAWNTTQSLPSAIDSQASVAYNGYLYTIGGYAGGDTSAVVFAPINATGSIGAWSTTQSLPYTDYYHTSVAYNGYLYTIGGYGNGAATSTVVYAPINATGSIGAWSVTQSLPYALWHQASVAYNGYLYVIGGLVNGTVDTSTILYAPINATGSIGVWSTTQSLPFIVDSHTSVFYNGYLYTIGGNINGAVTSAVEFAALNARSTYWGLSVPNATASGTYNGTILMTAAFSN